MSLDMSTIDFVSRPATPRWGWCLLVVGAVACGTALHADRRWAQERERREADNNARAAAAEQRRRDAAKPLPITADQRRQQRVAPLLRQPWLPTLRAIEATTRPPVYLVALTIDPTSNTVRLEGQAPSFDAALEYAKALGQEGLLAPAELRSHEQMVDSTGSTAVRFTAVTKWTAP